MGHEVLFYHSGAFAHLPIFQYVGRKEIFTNVDLENLSVEEIEGLVGDKKGEFDTVFYAKAACNSLTQITVLNESTKEDMVNVAKCEGSVKLFVVHITNLNIGRSEVKTDKSTQKRYKCRAHKEVEMVEEEEADSGDSEDDGDGDSGAENCSDEELNEIRKVRAEMRRSQKTLDEEEAEIIRSKLQRSRESGLVGGDNESHLSGSFDSLESEDSEDSEVAYAEPSGVIKKSKRNVIFNKRTAAKDIKFKPGVIFESKKEFKDAVRDYSIVSGRPLKFDRDDKQRISVVCDKGCPYSIWLSHVPEFDGWQIKTVFEEHNCVYNFNNKLVSAKYLAGLYGARIRRNPNWKLQDMIDEFKNVLNVEVNESKACRVRQKALGMVKEEMQWHYANLRRFGGEILKSNRDNTVKIQTTRENEGDAPHFQRFYVCFAGLKRAWKDGCRPVLGLDGCFLKTVCGGQLLSAVGRDAENSILPVAIAVVESECYDSWRWFLELVVEDLELGDGYGYTFISDQQKGLNKAISEIVPHVEHRFCTRHIHANLRKKFPSPAVKNAFWDAATATHPQAFNSAMRGLERASKGAAERMREFDPKVWTKSHFSTHSKCDSTDNNISECFNSWILKCRYMPIIDMITEIHDMLMERMYTKRDAMAGRDIVVVPRIKKILDVAILESGECVPKWDGNINFQVRMRGVDYCVNIQDRTCSCRVWELTGVPCAHAISAIKKMRHNPLDFVSHWYKKETYMHTYQHGLEVLRGEPFWEEVQGDIVLPPPIKKKLRGRPKRLRRREGWEGTTSKGNLHRLSRVGRVMHCSYCNGEGHNISGCKSKPDDWVDPKPKKKRGRKSKVAAEEENEMENITNEIVTGEAELMDEALRGSSVVSQVQPTIEKDVVSSGPRQSERLKGKQSSTISQTGSQVSSLSKGKKTKTVFMHTPSLVPMEGFGGTPPASTPPLGSSQQSSTVRKKGLMRPSSEAQNKKFKVPRKK